MAISFNPFNILSGFDLTKLNQNFQSIKTSLSDGLSRSGGSPNQMEADIDMNSNDLLNVRSLEVDSLIIDGVPAQVVELVDALKISNNLSDVLDDTVARTNIGAAKSGTNSDITSLSVVATINGFAPVTAAHVPNPSSSVQGTGVPGIDGGHWFVWNSQTGPTFDSNSNLRIDRNMSPTVVGGIPGNTYKALWVNGTAGVNNQGYEWPFTVELHNKALGTLNSQNVALNATAWVETNGVGETGRTWGSNLNVSDLTGTINPTYGRVGLEINNYATTAAQTDINRARASLQIAYGTVDGNSPGGGTPLHFGRGILIGSAQSNVILDRLLETSGNGTFDIGIDTTAATFSKPVYFMKEGQAIGFDGDTSGAFTRSMFYSSGSLAYKVGSNVVFTITDAGSISAAGNVDVAGEYRVDGVKVLSNRSTGWAAATGTATRTTFDTATVTTAQLAERVKALIDDLTTHGLIGA